MFFHDLTSLAPDLVSLHFCWDLPSVWPGSTLEGLSKHQDWCRPISISWGGSGGSYRCGFRCAEQWRRSLNSVDAAVASVLSGLRSISSLNEKQRMTLKAFLDNVFALLSTHCGNSLILPQVIGFVDLIGWSQSVIDSNRKMVYPITCSTFSKCLPFSSGASPDASVQQSIWRVRLWFDIKTVKFCKCGNKILENVWKVTKYSY